MPNRAAKLRKQDKRKANMSLSVNGRTSKQIARNEARNQKRKGSLG